MSHPGDSTFERAPDVRMRVVAGDAVVVRQEEAEVLVVSEVGGRILELMADGLTLAGVVDRLVAEYDVGRETLEADLQAFVTEMVESGVLLPPGAP